MTGTRGSGLRITAADTLGQRILRRGSYFATIAFMGATALSGAGCSSNNDGDQGGVTSSRSQALSNPSLPGQRKVGLGEAPVPVAAPNLLTYRGGRVVSNIQVVQVLYGPGSYLPQITNPASPSVATFYQGVLNSPYVSWLSEYNTTAPLPLPRTDQVIGNGSFSSLVMITPSPANNGAVIDSSNIEAELSAQIAAGTLPAPTHDAAGNNNTYYSVFFPHGKVETLSNVFASCSFFCAFHGTIANAGGKGEVFYGVQPDFQPGSGCEFGCGAASTPFGNVTQVASHELIETMTDPEVGTGPFAWLDPVGNEIGDLCNNQHGTVVGSDGLTYDVQTEYDNVTGNCIVSKSNVNQAPAVNAGLDQTITLPAAANLNGLVTDDGLPVPPGTVTSTWAKVSGPGTVTFANANSAITTATFSLTGTYVLRLTGNDSVLQASDDIQITVNSTVNQPPVVNAGADQTITLPAAASLNGVVTDDGLPVPPGTVTTTWAKVSGPGTVTFANASAKVTTATFSLVGTYVLRLTATDSALQASDDIQITVNAAVGGPCAGLCANPTNFTINGSFQSGNIGTGAVCLQTTSVVHGGNCGNFVSPRTLRVNGTLETCNNQNWASVPAARNGGYCIQTTAGNQPWAFITAF